jgi:hypothetical protein
MATDYRFIDDGNAASSAGKLSMRLLPAAELGQVINWSRSTSAFSKGMAGWCRHCVAA